MMIRPRPITISVECVPIHGISSMACRLPDPADFGVWPKAYAPHFNVAGWRLLGLR